MRSHAKAASAPSTHRENATFSLGVFAAMLVCAAAFLGIGASAAGAATVGQSYGYSGEIGSADSGQTGTEFNNAVAVSDDDGRVYVVRQYDPETTGGGVEVLAPDGTPLARVSTGSLLPTGISVAADGTYFFVTPAGGTSAVIQKFVRVGTSPLEYTLEPLWIPGSEPTPVNSTAVDPSSGDVLAVTSQRIYRVDANSGSVLSSFDGSTAPSGVFGGGGGGASVAAVAPDGDIYVGERGRILHMGADGSYKGTLDLGPESTGRAQPVGMAINTQDGSVAVEVPNAFLSPLLGRRGLHETVIRIYGSDDNPTDIMRVPDAVASENHGLAFSPDGSRLYVGNVNGSAHVYSQGAKPGVDSPAPSEITTTGVRLASAISTGSEPTTARFEYCLASDFCEAYLGSEGTSPWHRLEPDQTNLVGEATITGTLTGLVPNTRYLVRAQAIDESSHVESRSSNVEVHTTVPPPLVTTVSATEATETSALLSGSVDNTFGSQTTYYFEYGPTVFYGSRVPVGPLAIAGNLRTPRTFTQIVKGLQSDTEYHYRIVATNSGGTTAGADRTFITAALGGGAPQRAYEEVTPPDKAGLSISSNWGFQASPTGSAVEYVSNTPDPGSLSQPLFSRYVSRRGGNDWIGPQALDPPTLPGRAVMTTVTLAVSEDFDHALVVSGVALAPGASQGDTNIYVEDLDTGSYHLVGTSSQVGAFTSMTGFSINTFVAGAPDFSWVVLSPSFPLLPGVSGTALYRWTKSSGLSLLSTLPDGAIPTGRVSTPATQTEIQHLVSEDGSDIAFSLGGGDDGVYLRSGDDVSAISVAQQSGGPSGVQAGVVDGISREGRYVIFHSQSKLTDEAANSGSMNMYRYDALTKTLQFLGIQDGTNGGSTDVMGIGEDGKTVYFNGPLQEHGEIVEENGNRIDSILAWREGHEGLDDVYRVPLRGDAFGFASPSGRYFEFRSSNVGDSYLYDAGTGQTTCVSCRPSGIPAAVGFILPDRNISNRFPQVVTDNGHAYFSTAAPLLNSDRNAVSDVYEYFHGRLTLISPGDRDFPASLMGVASEGKDVFFSTAEGLVAQDIDQANDIYDARVGGGFPAQDERPPAGCSGEACQEVPGTSASVSTPGSSLNGGDGNVKPARQRRCPKNARKITKGGKVRCAKKRAHHKTKQSHRKRDANHGRRAGR